MSEPILTHTLEVLMEPSPWWCLDFLYRLAGTPEPLSPRDRRLIRKELEWWLEKGRPWLRATRNE